jgi:23S rRNA pseudouridine1911/1915/1917 synthase
MTSGLSSETLSLTVEARAHGWRVDHYLARMFPNYSRALFQKAIEQHGVLVNGLPVKGSKRLKVNDLVAVRLPEIPDRTLPPEDIPLDILYEDEWLVVLNKAAGMIVHPGRGHYSGTLAGALQFHFDRLSDVAGQLRPGIVHRLDRDTTGLLIVAKDNTVHHKLSGQFERREVRKEYRAIVHGYVERDSDYIETHMRVDPYRRERMCVCPAGGNAREAVTFYEVLERFARPASAGSEDFTYVRLLPRTGRTHQLRVHMRYLGHTIIADRLYGGREPVELAEIPQSVADAADTNEPEADEPEERQGDETPVAQSPIQRQALHAYQLEFEHPSTRKRLEFEAPLPADMQTTLELLRNAGDKRR